MDRRQVIWHVTMSVDGFITGRDDDMAPLFRSAGEREGERPGPMAEDVMHSIGAILAGRRCHDIGFERYGGREQIYGGKWNGPVFVLTHTPPGDPPDREIVFLTGPLEAAVERGLAAAGSKKLAIFGADVARQCIRAGLIDEIAIHVAPVLLGEGVPLFRDQACDPVRLERIVVDGRMQVTDLRFRVAPAHS
jgi:dihydrofolate reductase